jgi:hypothetical protein
LANLFDHDSEARGVYHANSQTLIAARLSRKVRSPGLDGKFDRTGSEPAAGAAFAGRLDLNPGPGNFSDLWIVPIFLDF